MPLRVDGRKAFKVRRGYARLGTVAPADIANTKKVSPNPSRSLVNWTVCVGRSLVYGSMEMGGEAPVLSSLRCLDPTVHPGLIKVTKVALEGVLGAPSPTSGKMRLVIASADGCPAEACVLAANCGWALCNRSHVPCHVVTAAASGGEYVLDPCVDEVEDATVECFAVSEAHDGPRSLASPLCLGLWDGGENGDSEAQQSFVEEVSPLIRKADVGTLFGEALSNFQREIDGEANC